MNTEAIASKVPAVTLGFWVIKVAATTLGETGGDTVSMTLGLGYLASTLIFVLALIALCASQVVASSARRSVTGRRMQGSGMAAAPRSSARC